MTTDDYEVWPETGDQESHSDLVTSLQVIQR